MIDCIKCLYFDTQFTTLWLAQILLFTRLASVIFFKQLSLIIMSLFMSYKKQVQVNY